MSIRTKRVKKDGDEQLSEQVAYLAQRYDVWPSVGEDALIGTVRTIAHSNERNWVSDVRIELVDDHLRLIETDVHPYIDPNDKASAASTTTLDVLDGGKRWDVHYVENQIEPKTRKVIRERFDLKLDYRQQ